MAAELSDAQIKRNRQAGQRRMASMTPEQRSDFARQGLVAAARAVVAKDQVDELADIRARLERVEALLAAVA